MKIASLVSRILLALIFLAAGASGFYFIGHPPPAPPGLAATFQDVFFKSGWVLYVDTIEIVCALALLANRFVPLALVTLAAVITNMAIFHLTMQLPGIVAPIVLAGLWFLIAWPIRTSFAPLLAATTRPR